MQQARFLDIGAAAELVTRDPQTIRRWANNGQVRRRTRGRIVEYHEGDLLALAGLAPLDEKDREISELRREVAQLQHERDEARALAKARQSKLDTIVSGAKQKYEEKDRLIRAQKRENEQLREEQRVLLNRVEVLEVLVEQYRSVASPAPSSGERRWGEGQPPARAERSWALPGQPSSDSPEPPSRPLSPRPPWEEQPPSRPASEPPRRPWQWERPEDEKE